MSATRVRERHIRESDMPRQFLTEAMESITDAFYVLDSEWRFQFVNRAAELFFNTNRSELLGRFYLDGWPEVENTAIHQALQEVFANGTPCEIETFSVRRPDRYIILSAVPLSSGGVAVSVKDITHRLDHKQELAAAALRLNSMLESTSDNVVLLDNNGNVEFANARAMASIGHNQPIVGRHLLDVVPTLKGSPLVELFRSSLDSKTSANVIHHSTSFKRWYDITVYPSDRGLSVFYRDITEQKQAEEQLAESERQFRELSNTMPQMVWKSDRGGNRYWYNQRWHDFTGASSSKSRGWGWVDYHHPEEQEAAKRQIRESLMSKEPWEGTYRIRNKQGEYSWFLVRAVPIFDRKGSVGRWFGTCTDITISIKDKQHQQLLLHELNHRVKNTLAIIQGIARQTRGDDSAEFRKLFENRLLALSKTHDLLTEGDWNSAPLRELIVSEMAPYVGINQTRYTLSGPNIKLKPQVVVPLGMAVHELATNAAKYGSLSKNSGHVDISWEVIQRERKVISVCWQERGGPPVEAPTRKGFGTRLLQHSFRGDFGGNVTTDYLPDGVRCTMEIPADHIVEGNEVRDLFRISKHVK